MIQTRFYDDGIQWQHEPCQGNMPKCFLNTVRDYQGKQERGTNEFEASLASSKSSISSDFFEKHTLSPVPSPVLEFQHKQRDIVRYKSMSYLPFTTRYQMIRQGTSVDVTGDPRDTSVHIEESPFVYDKSRWHVEAPCDSHTLCESLPDDCQVNPSPLSGSPPDGYHKQILTSMLTAGSGVALPGQPLDPHPHSPPRSPPSPLRIPPSQVVGHLNPQRYPVHGSNCQDVHLSTDTFIELQPVRIDETRDTSCELQPMRIEENRDTACEKMEGKCDTSNQPCCTSEHSRCQTVYIEPANIPKSTYYVPPPDVRQNKPKVVCATTATAEKILYKINQQVEAHTKEKTAIEALVAMSTTPPVGEATKQVLCGTTSFPMGLSRRMAVPSTTPNKTHNLTTTSGSDHPLLISLTNKMSSHTPLYVPASDHPRPETTPNRTFELVDQPATTSVSGSALTVRFQSEPVKRVQNVDSTENTLEMNTSEKEFERFKNESHAFAVDSNGNPIHRCTICDRVFTVLSAFASHVATHFKHKNKCTVCSKQFSRSWLLKGHMRTHTGERPYHCHHGGCNKAFADKSNLRSHTLIHRATDKNFTCPKCHRAFAQKRYLHKHKLEVCKI